MAGGRCAAGEGRWQGAGAAGKGWFQEADGSGRRQGQGTLEYRRKYKLSKRAVGRKEGKKAGERGRSRGRRVRSQVTGRGRGRQEAGGKKQVLGESPGGGLELCEHLSSLALVLF